MPMRVRVARRRDERGAAALIATIFLSLLMIPLSAVAVDTARWYVELERLQAAADAAATAGVTYMPDDFNSARARALEIAEDNGYTNSGGSTVAVAVGEKPTQLEVTVSATVPNAFGRLFGVNSSVMSRSAVADFNGPAPMGSPCNTFGNEPPGSSALGPVASQLKTPTYAQCSTTPEFWGAIAGPETHKDQGSQFETRKCGGGEDGCSHGGSGATNTEFDPRGFIYMVRVAPNAVGTPIQLQIYDPAYVDTGSGGCNGGPTGSFSSGYNYLFPYANTDAHQRYRSSANEYCSGDSDNNGKRFGSETATITSFALREPVDTLNPYQAPAHNPSQCTKQFPGYRDTGSNLSLDNLYNSGGGNPDHNLGRVFHQWVDLCTFTPTRAGDWYIQVRSNVAIPSSATIDSTGAYRGNAAVVNQTGDDTSVKGNGNNMFAMRAISSAPAGSVSVASWERMRIYANANAATTEFNLVRVVPAAANKTLVMSFFDVGEGASSGTVTVKPPADSNISTLTGCIGSGVRNGALSNCRVTNVTPSQFNGKYQEIKIPVPNTYTCQVSSQGGCWFRVQVDFGSGTVTDATTWTARIEGEPVRLIE